MSPKLNPIPPGYEGLTPYLYVHDAAAAIRFYKEAFGAKETFRMEGPGGKIGHAEVQIRGAHLMLADEAPSMGAASPKTIGGTPMCLLLYVEDVDRVVAQAVKAGATISRPVEDKFYGDRSGMIFDPFGHSWAIATHKEDVSPEEMDRRAAGARAQG